MIVFDASTLVSATFRSESLPARAVAYALQNDRVALSAAVFGELIDVLHRPKLSRFVNASLRAELLGKFLSLGIMFQPAIRVSECRDPEDDKYLELALAAAASCIVSSDRDLLVLSPWRKILIVQPARYLADQN